MRRMVAVAALVVAGCSGGTASSLSPTEPTSEPAVTTSSPAPCATPAAASAVWPTGVPAAFPRPPGMKTPAATHYPGELAVTVDVAISLHDSTQWVLRALPQAGFQLGEGDAEQDEADVPFSGNGSTGALRLRAVSNCASQWRLVIQQR